MDRPQLNIKDPETSKLVRELAELTGESQTEAVRKAVAHRLAQEKAERAENASCRTLEQQRAFKRTWAKIQRIQKQIKKRRLAENMLTDADLYDEHGLPK